jgi:hypothetical protein
MSYKYFGTKKYANDGDAGDGLRSEERQQSLELIPNMLPVHSSKCSLTTESLVR